MCLEKGRGWEGRRDRRQSTGEEELGGQVGGYEEVGTNLKKRVEKSIRKGFVFRERARQGKGGWTGSRTQVRKSY